MTEFAELLGTDQSTISRYESGQVVPSRTILILLFLLASVAERESIREAMGSVSEAMLMSRYEGAREALKDVPKGSNTSLAVFAEESAAIVSSKEPIEPAFVELVKLFRRHGRNRKLRQAMEQFVPYLEFIATRKT